MDFDFTQDDEWYKFRLGNYSVDLKKDKKWSTKEIAFVLESLTNFYTKSQDSFNQVLITMSKELESNGL